MNDENRDEPMIDLPLGHEGAEPDTPPEPPSLPAAGGGAALPSDTGAARPDDRGEPELGRSPGPEPGPKRRGPRGRRMAMGLLGALALLVLLALAVLAGYLLPRPGPPVLRVEPALADFGQVRVGQTGDVREVTLTSAGDLPVKIADLTLDGPAAAEFRIAGDACSGVSLESHQTCVVAVRFAPGDATPRRASLEIPSDASNGSLSVPLTGEGVAPRPAVDRSRIEFAPQAAGSRSEPVRVVLSNRGSASYRVPGVALGGADAAAFSVATDRCTGAVLDPGADCTVGVAFSPAASGESHAVLRFAARGRSGESAGGPGAEPSVELVGTALSAGETAGETTAETGSQGAGGTPARLTVEPAKLDLGEVRVGTTGGRSSVVVHNTGGAPAAIQGVAASGPDAEAFVLAGDRCAGSTLAPDERCTVAVTFRPRREGTQQAQVVVRSEAVAEPVTVALRGTGTAPHLGLGATRVTFGQVRVSTRVERKLTLTSSGRSPLEIRGLAISGPAASDFRIVDDPCSKSLSLAPQDQCTLTLEVAPSAEGDLQATLVVRHDGPGSPAEVELVATALPPPAPAIAHSPAAVAFGAQPVGRRSSISTVEVANRGTARLVIAGMELGGADPGDFQIVPGSCEGAPFLVPDSTCTVGLRFVPSAPGTRRARLLIHHNAEGGTEVVELAGRGVPGSE